MSGVEFNEENEFNIKSRKHPGHYSDTKMERFLINKKIVKNKKQAHYLLLGVSVFLLASAIVLYFVLLKEPNIKYIVTPEGEKIETEEYIKMLGRGENPLD